MWEYNYSTDDELYHHGVRGMKWGVRRYQNPDGSLTNKGRNRMNRIERSDRRTEKHKLFAMGDAKRLAKISDHKERKYEKKVHRLSNKDSKYSSQIKKASKEGNVDRVTKLTAQRERNTSRLSNSQSRARRWAESYNVYNTRYNNIDNGTLRAGRDFMTRTRIRTKLFGAVGVLISASLASPMYDYIERDHD